MVSDSLRPPGARRLAAASALLFAAAACGCGGAGGNAPAPPPPCDQACQDNVALMSTRVMMKLAFNLTLQGKPVGAQSGMTPCPGGGTAQITGTASSNAVQGSTDVDLTYVFDQCAYQQKDTAAEQNFDVTLSGTVTEKGTLAVQSSATTALTLQSGSITLTGTVYDPPLTYAATACPMTATQDGNNVTGMLCERPAFFAF